jgi:multiple sugar transport system permease protein
MEMMFSEMDSGLITSLAHFIVPTSRPRFLSSPAAALASSVVANVWRGTAYSMILLYAGLMTFPNDLNEASQIDGANAFQRLFQIKLCASTFVPYLYSPSYRTDLQYF